MPRKTLLARLIARLLERRARRREVLEQALREGEESGGEIPAEQVWAELEAAHPWLKLKR